MLGSALKLFDTGWFSERGTQDIRGGEELQEGDYRVIAQMGMGLMAQWYAEI